MDPFCYWYIYVYTWAVISIICRINSTKVQIKHIFVKCSCLKFNYVFKNNIKCHLTWTKLHTHIVVLSSMVLIMLICEIYCSTGGWLAVWDWLLVHVGWRMDQMYKKIVRDSWISYNQHVLRTNNLFIWPWIYNDNNTFS